MSDNSRFCLFGATYSVRKLKMFREDCKYKRTLNRSISPKCISWHNV